MEKKLKPPSQGKVLVIDDDTEVIQAVEIVLRGESFKVLSATSGEEALQTLNKEQPDVIILDLGLPDIDGFELLEAFQKNPQFKSIPVIVLTGWSGDDLLIRALELGALEFLNKPFMSAELLARVRNILFHKKLRDSLAMTNRLLDQAKVKAEKASRVKTEFLGLMSHEFRTPLNGILALSNLIKDTPLTPDQKEMLDTIHHSGGQLMRVLNEVLDLSRLESGNLNLENHPFDLRYAIEEVIDLYYAEATGKGLEMAYSLERGCPVGLAGDSSWLKQVLAHLISNAVKFTHQGEIHLLCRKLEKEQEGSDDSSVYIEFILGDTGIGVKGKDKKKIFQSFVQGDSGIARKYGGAGLGLAISERIVMMMGGTMRVETKTDGGSVFRFTLPFQLSEQGMAQAGSLSLASRAPDSPGTTEEKSIPVSRKLRILLVDDNQINQRIGARLMQRMGLTTDVAANGNEAVQMVKTIHYDFVFMDVQMPVLDGIEATREIRKWEALKPSQPSIIIGLSAGFEESDRKNGMEAGMNDYLSKPLLPKALELCFQKWNKQMESSAAIKNENPICDGASGPGTDHVVDHSRLMEMADQDKNEADLLTITLTKQVRDGIAMMRGMAEEGDKDGIRVKAHSIAGAAGTCGFTQISTLAKKLEQAIAAGEKPDLEVAFSDLEKSIQMSCDSLNDFLLSK